MEKSINEIRPGYADKIINDTLAAQVGVSSPSYTRHFNQGEEYFLELEQTYMVPNLPIHHDVRQDIPSDAYLIPLREWVKSLLPVSPPFFKDLTYFFNPAEPLKPCFYRLYRLGEDYYLFLLQINLAFRPLEAELIDQGSNDLTSSYRTNRLYLESEAIPLASVVSELGKVVSFQVRQTISQTWIGETGKGYMVRGIWMDSELSKFFTKLFLPAGKRSYPYYPFTCKYKTVCLNILDPSPEDRRRLLPVLHNSLAFLIPEMERIEAGLKAISFSESLPIFTELKAKVDKSATEIWKSLLLTPYLNKNEQKEFRVEF